VGVPGDADADPVCLMARDRLAPITRKVNRYRRALELKGPDTRRYTDEVGPPLKAEILRAGRAAAGDDLQVFKNKATKLGVGYDVTDGARGVTIVFKLRPPGLWAMAEQGARPHVIGGGRNYRRGRKRVYVHGAGYSHPVQAPIWHPGSKGKGGIRYAFKLARRAQRAAQRDGVLAVWRSVK
jgi:hypothetical protein